MVDLLTWGLFWLCDAWKDKRDMKHIWFPGTAAVLGGVLFYGYTALTSAAQADSLDGRLLSDPDPQSIHAQIEGSRSQATPLSETDRQNFFAELFTHRIRGPQPSIAVRVAFVAKDPKHVFLRLMCPARMEPWNMDRLAVQVWREAKDCLGQSYDVDMYETYIGAAPRKAGELRCSQASPFVAAISHNPARCSAQLRADRGRACECHGSAAARCS